MEGGVQFYGLVDGSAVNQNGRAIVGGEPLTRGKYVR